MLESGTDPSDDDGSLILLLKLREDEQVSKYLAKHGTFWRTLVTVC